MQVTMRIAIGGYRNGQEWPAPGGTIDVPDHEAADLIANGYAVATEPAADDDVVVDDAPAAKPKSKKKGKADATPAESADDAPVDQPVDPAADEPPDGPVDDPFEGL